MDFLAPIMKIKLSMLALMNIHSRLCIANHIYIVSEDFSFVFNCLKGSLFFLIHSAEKVYHVYR